MAWISLPSVSVANGDITVSVTGSKDLSGVLSGWALIINNNYVEIKSGTSADGSGNSTLTLAEPWDGSTITNQPAKIMPTSAPQLEIAQLMTDTNDYAIDVHSTLAEIATLDKDVTIKDPTGEDHTFATMPKNARLIEESINENTSRVDALLANKTADGDDTTPGALLAVGATVKQLDLTNSNVRYEPSVKPTLRADFANNKYTLYDSETNTYADKSITDVFDITRDTPTTVTTPTGKVISVGIDKPAFDFESGVAQGLRTNQGYTNLFIYSEISGQNYPDGTTSANWEGSTIVKNNITLDKYLSGVSGFKDYETTSLKITASLYFYDDGTGTATDATIMRLQFNGSSNYQSLVKFNFITKQFFISNDVGVAALITSTEVSNGFYRVSLTLDASAATSLNVAYVRFVWSPLSDILIGGFQLTTTAYSMPYAKTEGLEVTVEPDSVTRDLGEEFNPDEFSIFLRLLSKYPVATGRVLQILNDSEDDRIDLIRSNSDGSARYYFSYIRNGVSVSNTIVGSSFWKEDSLVLLSINMLTGRVTHVMNGGVRSADINLDGFTAFTKIRLEPNSAFLGINELNLYPLALSESDSTQLTRGAN